MTTRQFVYGKYKYQYVLILQDRKTFSLVVFPDRRIMLKAPDKIKDEKIEAFLKKKWRWLERQLNFFAKFQRKKTKKDYVSGESFLYLGRQYKLIVKRSEENRVSLQCGQFVLYTTGKLRDGKKNKKLIDEWYKRKIRKVFVERCKEVSEKFDYNFIPNLVVRKMNRRWGSFTKNHKVILNPLLIQASKKSIDYVITHELCHMKYKNHDKRFYKVLDLKYPNWEKAKEELELRLFNETM